MSVQVEQRLLTQLLFWTLGRITRQQYRRTVGGEKGEDMARQEPLSMDSAESQQARCCLHLHLTHLTLPIIPPLLPHQQAIKDQVLAAP